MDIVTPGVGLVFWTSISFLIVLFILSKFAWGPIINGLKSREASIQEALDAAKKAQADIKKLESKNEQLAQEAREERDRIVKEARETAAKTVEEAQAKATAEYNRTVSSAQGEIEREKEAALKEIRNQVAELSLAVAEKLIKRQLADDASQKQLVDEYIKDLNIN